MTKKAAFLEKTAKESSRWDLTYNARGWWITFDGKNVGGAGVVNSSRRATRADREFQRQQGLLMLNDCRLKHHASPFDPEEWGCIWPWLGSVSAK